MDTGPMELGPLHKLVIQNTQIEAIINKGFLPDEKRYGYASGKLFQELLDRNQAADEITKINLEATRRLMRQIGPFQNPVHLFKLVEYNRDVLTAARSLGVADDSWVPFASATIGSLNAATRQTGNAYVIIYNDGLFTLAELLGRQFSYAIGLLLSEWGESETMEEASRRLLGTKTPIISSIISTITSYAVTGDARNYVGSVPRQFVRDSEYGRFFRDSIVRFVVAHELGHVYLSHMEPQPVVNNRPVTASYRWQQEYDADLYATRVLLEMMLNRSSPGCVEATPDVSIALQLSLVVMILAYAAEEYINVGEVHPPNEGVGTHPPSDVRFRYVRGTIDQSPGLYPSVNADDLEIGHEIVRILINRTLPALRDQCLQLRAEGVRAI